MATRVSFRQWDGGDGMHDRFLHLLECKETPKEVLSLVFKNFLIYSYKGISTPVDRRPYNIDDQYAKEIFSTKGISIHDLNLERLRGYDYSIGRSPMIFEKTVAGHIKSELDPRYWYQYKGLEKLEPLRHENYLCLRDSELVTKLKSSKEELYYTYPSGEQCKKPFIGKKWVAEQEAKLQIILEIAQVVFEGKFNTIEGLKLLYEKYKPEKAHVY